MCAGGEYRGVRHDRHFNATSPQHSLSTRALRRNLVERKIRNKRPSSAYTILPIGGLRGTIPSGGPLDKRRAFCAIVGTTGDTWRKPEFRARIWRGYFRRSSTLSIVARRLSRLRSCRPAKTDGQP